MTVEFMVWIFWLCSFVCEMRTHLFWLVLSMRNWLMKAWNACPVDVRETNSCLNSTDWRIIVPFNTKMTISQRRATTVFNRFNFTITDVINLSDPTPTIYDINDFFIFYEIIFAVNETTPQWWQSTQYMFLLGIVSFLGNNVPTENGTGSDDRLSRLQEFLVTPTFLFNNVVFRGPLEGLGTSASLAIPSYRVILNIPLSSLCS
jgi:hypothetical protein